MRAVLADRLDGVRPGGSEKEADVAKLLLGGGLPRPVQQHRVRIGRRVIRLDFAYPELQIAIEYDGWQAHRTRLTFDSDRARDNELEIRGWLVLRFTSRWTRGEILSTVRAAVASRTATDATPEQLTVVADMRGTTVNCSQEAGAQAMQSAPRRTRRSA